MSRAQKLKQLSRLVAARATVAERELAKANQTELEMTAEADTRRKLWSASQAEAKAYVATRFAGPRPENTTSGQFFQSIAIGSDEKRRQETIARIKSEQQSVKAGTAVKARMAEAKRYLAITQRQDGLREILKKINRAADQSQQLKAEDALCDVAPRKDTYGTA